MGDNQAVDDRAEREVEAMDGLIRAFDLADQHGLDIDDLIDRVRQGR